MIILKSRDEIEKMAKANKIVASVLSKLEEKIAPGITTIDLDRIAHEMIVKNGGKPSFLGYRGYPKSICTSINEEVVHGIPGKRVLEEGDIISIDCGVTLDGFIGDSAVTVPVGSVSADTQKLLRVTNECLAKGIDKIREGLRIGDIGNAIQTHAESHGYSVVRDFVGHGIGRKMHEEPQVFNFGKPGTGPRVQVGMVLALEPMVNMGGYEVEVLKDQWTVVTKDRKPSAHFEHSVVCTEKGPWVLSSRD